jgi:hypothetical protein
LTEAFARVAIQETTQFSNAIAFTTHLLHFSFQGIYIVSAQNKLLVEHFVHAINMVPVLLDSIGAVLQILLEGALQPLSPVRNIVQVLPILYTKQRRSTL